MKRADPWLEDVPSQVTKWPAGWLTVGAVLLLLSGFGAGWIAADLCEPNATYVFPTSTQSPPQGVLAPAIALEEPLNTPTTEGEVSLQKLKPTTAH